MYYAALLLVLALGSASAEEPPSSKAPDSFGTAGNLTAVSQVRVEAAVDRLERRYNGLKGFSADFVQNYTPRGALIGLEYHGEVHFRKPGKMRWIYQKPEQKEILSDGIKLWLYKPLEKQVIVSDFDRETLSQASGISFLWGKAELRRLFDIAPSAEEAPTGKLRLVLTTKKEQRYYHRIVFLVDEQSGEVKEVTVHEVSGGINALRFAKSRENKDLKDAYFTFSAKGVEVKQAPLGGATLP
ncbi:MAG: hypothetical protein A2284_03420 [Deltaproteobacteria bacterium RIFOXYA12_FULL_61_11]|nr:MAG: hypothetical protein A2284_03420 [Deltaproteobacteria bacterium RIFOXYA12_FULL_61_11]